jgi:DNA polymerase elongation subunit (family B)
MAQKVLLNSFYGAYGNASFRYFSLDHAKSITSMGRAGIQHVAVKVNEWLQKVFKTDFVFRIYGDTDSIYFSLTPLLELKGLDPTNPAQYDQAKDILKKFVDGPMADRIKQICLDYAEWRNVPENMLDMEREAISTLGGIFIAKKRYAIAVDDMEGVSFPRENLYYKIMGMDAVKSGSATKVVREALMKITKEVIEGSQSGVWDIVSEFKTNFMKSPVNEIATMTGCNEIDKWVDASGGLKLGTPIGPKSAYYFNKYVESIDAGLPRIEEGDKIMYIRLRKGNPVGSDTFAFIEWSSLLDHLVPYIDLVYMYDKNFIQKVTPILQAVTWSSEPINTLF